MASGNKPRKSVESSLYAGRKSFGGKDGLGPYDEKVGLATPDRTAEQAKGYGGDDITKGWWHDGDGVATDKPNFDHDKSRKGNDAPSAKGGRESFPSPFSAAARNIK